MAEAKIDIEALKSRHDLSAIVARRVKLRRAGHELVGLCPFHNENTPSFRVNDTKGAYNCFGCGAHGDVLDFIMAAEGLHFMSAVRWLEGSADLPAADPADRERDERIERKARAAAIVTAQAQWRAARSTIGTPAERYLRSRGIIEPVPPSIRFGRVPLWRNKKTGLDGRPFPALIAACQDVEGKVVGVQRVFLTEDGRKAPIANPKLSLGKVRGCALRLGPPARSIRLCEGPGDGLTIRQRYPGPPAWVTLGTGALPFVELPDEVEKVTIMATTTRPAARRWAPGSRRSRPRRGPRAGPTPELASRIGMTSTWERAYDDEGLQHRRVARQRSVPQGCGIADRARRVDQPYVHLSYSLRGVAIVDKSAASAGPTGL